MTPQDRDRYLQWLREVLKEKYEAMGAGWQDHNADLDEFLSGIKDEYYDAGYNMGQQDADNY